MTDLLKIPKTIVGLYLYIKPINNCLTCRQLAAISRLRIVTNYFIIFSIFSEMSSVLETNFSKLNEIF